jgi:hypothetical protein
MESLKKVEDVVYEMNKTAETLMYKIWALRELRDVADEKELTELLKRVLDMYIKELTELRKRLG